MPSAAMNNEGLCKRESALDLEFFVPNCEPGPLTPQN